MSACLQTTAILSSVRVPWPGRELDRGQPPTHRSCGAAGFAPCRHRGLAPDFWLSVTQPYRPEHNRGPADTLSGVRRIVTMISAL